AVDSSLRKRGVGLAKDLGLRTQTHLNEQRAEKEFVEKTLYPNSASYTEVYYRDGLLDCRCIVAHCIHMTDGEWKLLVDNWSAMGHCTGSNWHVRSGRMPLDGVIERRIPYAIATDVGASPTVSLLAEAGRFLTVHAGQSGRATPEEALYRITLAPAKI